MAPTRRPSPTPPPNPTPTSSPPSREPPHDHAPGPRRHTRPPPTRRRRMHATHLHHPLRRRRPRTHTHRHQREPVTTSIRDTAGTGRFWIIRDADTHVSVTVSTSDGTIARASLVARAEFLAAVRDELDVIIIDRADLPPVEEQNDVLQAGHIFLHRKDRPGRDPGEQARAWLALAEHLEHNPPIDEAQVNALARLVAAETNDTHIPATALARRLIQAGVRMDGAK